MKIKGMIIIALVFLVAFAFGCARSWHHHSPEKKAEWMVKKISRELDLNDQQRATLNKIKEEILVKKDEFKGTHSEIADEFLLQVKSDRVDEARLNQVLMDKEMKMKEMRSFLVTKFGEFHSVLTPEQRTKLAAKIEKKTKRM